MTSADSNSVPAQSASSPPAHGPELLTLQQAAEHLGLHYMTVYRYVRTGRLPGTRQGGEWRIATADLTAVKNETARRKPGRSPKGVRTWPRRFETQLLAGDEAGAWTVVQDALASGVEPEQFHLTVLIPTMKSIGSRWEQGSVTIAEEHQASAIAHRVVGRMGPQFTQRGRKRGHILLAAPPQDHHNLPIAIFADLLRSRHFRVSDLGADVPIASLLEFLNGLSELTAVGIGVTTPHNQANVADLVTAIKDRSDVPVVLGGSGLTGPKEAAELGADAWSGPGEQGLRLFDRIGSLGVVPEQDRLMVDHE